MDLQYEPENLDCQRAHACETEFAISSSFGEAGILLDHAPEAHAAVLCRRE